jgi:aryl-alcohol dehydrogenase-like predicted oxidoreductase
LGRLEYMDAVLIFGGAALAEVSEEEADRAISASLEAGVNHFDTAAGYGNSELHLGHWMAEIRDDIFLSTKTDEREKEASKRQIHNSLHRLGVDHVDLIQLHAVGDPETLDRVTRDGGSLEATVEAKEEGLARAIGITGHGHQTPAVHLEALRRYPFDTVMTPWNFVLSRDEVYRRDYEALVEEVKRQDVGLMTIKTVSKRNWLEGDPLSGQRYATWYEPFDEQEHVDAAVAFVLSQEEITGIPMVGDVDLIRLMIEAEKRRMPIEEAEETLSQVPAYSSPFIDIPF